jgi:O-methyltransferase
VIVADSFAGLPPPSEQFPADAGADFHTHPELAVSLEQVWANFRRFGLLDDQVVFLEGWFRDTMPRVEAEALAVLRLDGDMYESTFVPLVHLYDRVAPGGWVIVDDYHLMAACREAVGDFLADRGIDPPLHDIDRVGVYFRKE